MKYYSNVVSSRGRVNSRGSEVVDLMLECGHRTTRRYLRRTVKKVPVRLKCRECDAMRDGSRETK